MATANDLITTAYKRGRIVGDDETLSSSDAASGLSELNRMLDEWWNERLAVFRIQQENFPLVAGQATRTIGTGGQFNTTRPVKLSDGCFVRRSGVDYPVAVLEDRALYDSIPVKTTSGLVDRIFYDPAMALGTLYFYPVPDQADTIFLNSLGRLQSVASLVTAISLPPGYESLIVNGLAIRLCPDNGLEAPASVQRAFGRTMHVLKRANAPSLVMSVDPVLPSRRARHDITIDE